MKSTPKHILLFFFFLISLNFSSLTLLAHQATVENPKSKEYNLSICTVFKDEAPYLKEWIEYHRLVGVDHFYLYNNESTDHFREVLDPYIEEGIVTLIYWPEPFPGRLSKDAPFKFVHDTQVPGFEHAIRLSAPQTTWLATIDADEFMVPVKDEKMTDVLERHKQHACVLLTWHTYGTGGVKSLPDKTLLIEALNRTAAADDEFNTHGVKSIVKPEYFSSYHWPPHVCLVKDEATSVYVTKDEARLNHYFNRTEDHFLNKKIKCKEHTSNKKLSEGDIDCWRNLGNAVEDEERYIHRFVPKLRKRMGFDSADSQKSRKKILVNAFYAGNIFDPNPFSNRDECNTHFHLLKDQLAAEGFDMELVYSLENLESFDYLFVLEIPPAQIKFLDKYPKDKLTLFLWEPPSVLPENYEIKNHRYFSKVFTWKDDLIDNETYFKFYYPYLRPMIADPLSFQEKKLCTMIACNKYSSHSNELYTERQNVIRYFEDNHLEDFDLYGRWWDTALKTYKGEIPSKADCMKGYRFCFAYENIKNVPGYVTEKIFDCFHAGCVPIYFGAPNITDYIPKECFISKTDYESYDQLYDYLKQMKETEYQEYIHRIQDFLKSDKGQLYSRENYINTIVEKCL